MEDFATRCLKYGDTIYLKVDGKPAFISAQDRATPQIRTEELSDAAESPPDLKDCLFEVTKKYQYTQQASLVYELAKHGLAPEEVLANDAFSLFEEHVSKAVKGAKEWQRMVSLFNAYLREKRTNDNEFKQVVGESVLYGQVIQLRHVATGKFVTIKRTAADVERGALKVVLDDGGQEGSWFQVFSGYRTKPEGAKLMPGEVVALKGLAFSGNGLHISGADISDPTMLPMDKHPYVTSAKEVCASPDVSAFKVIPFSVHDKVFPAIRERLCGMSAVSIQDLVANTVYINILGAINEKYLYFESPLTRPDPNRITGPDSWRLELVVDGGFWCGMPLTHGSQIRIRHLPTGCYLAAVSTKAKDAARALRSRKTLGMMPHDIAATMPPTPVAAAAAAAAASPAAEPSAQGLPGGSASDADVLYDEAFRLVLTKRYNVPDTLWELNTFTKEDVVGSKVYAFFKHVATQFWLSGAGPPIPPSGPVDPDDPPEEQVFPIVHPEKLERNVMLVIRLTDGFTSKVLDLQRVMVQLKEIRHVLHKERVPPEAELMELVRNGQTFQALEAVAATSYPDKFRQRWPALKRSLRDLVRWLDKNTWSDAADTMSPHIEYQNLFRELGMIDLLVQYLDAARVRLFAAADQQPGTSTKTGHWVVESGKLCHRILQLCCQANEANQAYLTKFAGMVMSHLSSPLTAPDTLAAMYEDNMAQMQTVSPEIVAASVQLIREYGLRPRFINFLRQICGTRGRPMPNNQNWIVAETMGSGRNPLDVFCRAGPASLPDAQGQERGTWAIRALVKGGSTQEVLVDASQFALDDEDLTKRAIKEWDLSGVDDSSFSPREIFIYYCFSLKFVVSLCYGRNSLARAQILRASAEHGLGLEFEALQQAVTNRGLPFCLRCVMVQVIRALYVDIEPYQPLKLPRHIRMMSRKGAMRLTQQPAAAGAAGANSEAVNQLIGTVLAQLKGVVETVMERTPAAAKEGADEAGPSAQDLGERTVGRNALVLNFLKMVREMFQLGMMVLDSPITQEMLSVLLELIQKFDSMPLDRPERFERSYASRVVMNAKKVALQTIDFALDMKSELQCAAMFERFAEWQRSPERLELWARKQAGRGDRLGQQVKSMAAGLLGVRAAATLGIAGGNRVAPSPADQQQQQQQQTGESQDLEAPPPKEDSEGGSGPVGDGGLAQCVAAAAGLLASENEEGDFPLFRLDTLSDTEPLYRQHSSPIMKLFDLVRYEDQDLTARTFQLLERLTSKREKLLEELMRTFVVTDDDLIALATWAMKQIETAQHAYNYMGSLDPAESAEACGQAARAIDQLTSLLVPLRHITVPGGGPDGAGQERVFVSKTTAANCQYLMADMQVHLMVLKFLKLPLKRKHNPDARRLQEADDPARREVFRACLEFLRHFMVVGDMDAANVPSHANQAAVLPSLELLLSFLDTHGLPASDTIIALFITNQADATSEGDKVIRKLIKLITRYGDKQHAGWLELLGKVMVVDGVPLKRNQMAAMQLITQYSEDVLLLLPGDAGAEELRGLLAAEHLTARPCAEPPVSRLAYHTACVQLLADCCAGKEPELVVKTSGYMSLAQVLDVLLLQPSAQISETNLRYVQRAYWRLLQNCYFATDTDNTKVQVRNGGNRIWPADAGGGQDGEEGDGGTPASLLLQRFLDIPAGAERKKATGPGSSCLMQSVLEEVKRALADPSDALGNADSATFFLATAVFPALTHYFDNHWHSHQAKLNVTPTGLLSALYNHLMDLEESLKRLKDVANTQVVKAELKTALSNTRALVRSMPSEANTEGRGLTTKRSLFGGGKTSAPSTSQHTAATAAVSQQVVQREWTDFVRRLAGAISVDINRDSYEVVEVLHSHALMAAAANTLGFGEVAPIFEQASLLRLARMLAAKFGRLVPGSNPPMCFEKLIAMLCELLASRNGRDKAVGPPDWRPALMVKMVRTVCAAAVLDDGAGAEDGAVLRDAWASMGYLRMDDVVVDQWQRPSAKLLEWRQGKYDKLGATRAAVTLLAHPMPEVQLEALKLLEVLLQGGNRSVQATIFDILKDGSELADAVFANFKAAFTRCRKYVATEAYLRPGSTRAVRKKAAAGEAAKKALLAAVNVLGNAGGKVVGAAGAVGGKVVGAAGAVGGKVVGAAGAAGGKVVGAVGAAGGKVVDVAGAAGGKVAGAAGAVGGKVKRTLVSAAPSEGPSVRSRLSALVRIAPTPAQQGQGQQAEQPQPQAQAQEPAQAQGQGQAGGVGGGASLRAVPEYGAMAEGPASAARAASSRSLAAARPSSATPSRRLSRSGSSSGSRRASDDNAPPGTSLPPHPPPPLPGSSNSPESPGESGPAPGQGARPQTAGSGAGAGLVPVAAVAESVEEDEVTELFHRANTAITGSRRDMDGLGPRPIGEATEGSEADDGGEGGGGGGGGEDEDEEEVRWEDKTAQLNAAGNAYEFNRVLLSVLKSMVEGHYKNLQRLLQHQPNSTSSLDLVVEAVDLLNVLQDHLPTSLRSFKHEVAHLMVLVCNFVQEMVQGPCFSNQQSLAGTNFLASCNRVFGCIEYSEKYVPILDDTTGKDRRNQLHKCSIKCALLNLLTSLLEASPSEDIPGRCYDILDFDVIDRQISRLCRVLGMAGQPPRYPPDGEDVAECDDQGLIHMSSKLEDELLLLCSYVLKLSTVTPSRAPPLPYIVDLFNGEDVEKLDDLTPEQLQYAGELQAFLQRRLGYVEINWKGQLIEPCFFKLTPECSNLVTSTVWCEGILDRINNTVSPDSRAFPTVKAAELVEVLEDVVEDITLQANLTKTKWLKAVSIIGRYRKRLLELTFYLAVATLIFQALADARWGPHTSWAERGSNWEPIVLSVAVALQTFCTLLLYTSFVYTDLNKYLRNQVPRTSAALSKLAAILTFRSPNTSTSASSSSGIPGPGASGASTSPGAAAAAAAAAAASRSSGSSGGRRGKKEEEEGGGLEGASAALALGLPPPPLDERRGWVDLLQGAVSFLLSIATATQFWYFNMLVGASLAGFFVSPFFLVFHFTIYFIDFDSGKQLVLAIQRSGINILNTFVLAVLAIYVFAVVTFLVFKDPTAADKGDGPPCDTFYQCMGAHMLTGIMGDISSLFNSDLWDTVPESVGQDGLQQARTIFVLFFFMIWNFVLSNIFVGLIASAFEAIRDDQNTITSDRLSKCLICSQDMYLFNEKIQGGFDEHITKQHSALAYVFFLHHLAATDVEDFTGAESVVAHVLDSAKTTTDKGTWLPVSKSLAIIHANATAASNAGKDAAGGGQ